MKTFFCFIQVLALVWEIELKAAVISLQEAIDRKRVSVKVLALGGHSGNCAELLIRNLSKNKLLIEVEAGRRLNSVKDSEQDLLIVKDYTVEVESGSVKNLRVKAYCCQADHFSPGKKSPYEINKIAELPLYLLARYLSNNSYEADIEQKAVWAISNQRSVATIAGSEDSLLTPLRQMVASIKGETLPWYTLFTKTNTLSDGSMQTIALELKGDLTYSNSQECYMTLHVLNERGMPVCMVKCEWLKACVQGKYPLSISVKMLPKGRYTVEMVSRERSIARQDFEI